MPFNGNTRQKFIPLDTMPKPTGGGIVSRQLPKTGFLGRLWLRISGTVAGSLSAPNALGMASVVRRVRLAANSGIDIFSVSGAGYHYLLREIIDVGYVDPFGQSNARSAVTATTFNLDMVIPIMLNLKDPLGLLMLQNEQTILTLTVEFEADATVATGATVMANVYPRMELFTVPPDKKDWPPLGTIHQILEDTQTVAAAGDFVYNVPRGNTVLQLAHGLGIGASGADGFNLYRLRAQQSEYLYQAAPADLDMEQRFYRGRARPAGAILVDWLATSGLGVYGLTRDAFDTSKVTDFASIITASGAGTLYTVRRQLVGLRAA